MDPLLEIVGESPAIEAVRAQLRRLLARPVSGRRLPAVLIEGETGSGKGLVARVLHRAGPRATGPYVEVNCSAIPETLLEAELFGFERGAFTDARQAKPGLFQTAHQGTIFLDEIGLLPEALGAKLLKVLEEGAVRRLGSTRSEPIDVWILSATNTDLPTAVRERRFREDLYHRLAVLTLTLPPLRERGGDVVLLAERFLARACEDYGLPRRTLAPDARERLLAHSWPGNIRELSNVMERVALLADAVIVTGALLGLPEESPRGGTASAGPGSLHDAMGGHLRSVLEETGWNISRTAARLAISRNTLRARIARLGMRREAGAPPAREPRAGRPRVPVAPVPSVAPPAPPGTPEPAALRWEGRQITFLRAWLAPAPDQDELSEANRALEALVEKIVTFGGRVEELGHAGLDACFGLDPAEDAPRRAAHAALAIQRAGQKAREADPQQPTVRLALDTDACLVGQVAGVRQIDQTAKRRAAAQLAALIAAADPGGIVVGAGAGPLLERHFELVPAGTGVSGGAFRLVGRGRRVPSPA